MKLSIPEQHQKRIALSTLRMSDAMAGVMGGMDKEQAREFLLRIGYSQAYIKELDSDTIKWSEVL